MAMPILKKFGYAWNGIKGAFKAEQSFRIQLAVAAAVAVAGLVVGLTQMEWLFVIMAIGTVLSLELLNTMIEKTLDLLHPAQHERVRLIKDVSAAAVLISSAAAMIVGLLVFQHHFRN